MIRPTITFTVTGNVKEIRQAVYRHARFWASRVRASGVYLGPPKAPPWNYDDVDEAALDELAARARALR